MKKLLKWIYRMLKNIKEIGPRVKVMNYIYCVYILSLYGVPYYKEKQKGYSYISNID